MRPGFLRVFVILLCLYGSPAFPSVLESSLTIHKEWIVGAWEELNGTESSIHVAKWGSTGSPVESRTFRRAPLQDLGFAIAVVSTGDRLMLVWRERLSLLAAFLTDDLAIVSDPFVIIRKPERSSTIPSRLNGQWDGERVVLVWLDEAGIEGALLTSDATVTRLGTIVPLPSGTMVPLPTRTIFAELDLAVARDGFAIATAAVRRETCGFHWCAIDATPLLVRFDRDGSLIDTVRESPSLILDRPAVARGDRTTLFAWAENEGVRVRITDDSSGQTLRELLLLPWLRPRAIEAAWVGSAYVIAFVYQSTSWRVAIVQVDEWGYSIGNPRSFPGGGGSREILSIAGDVLVARAVNPVVLDGQFLSAAEEMPPHAGPLRRRRIAWH